MKTVILRKKDGTEIVCKHKIDALTHLINEALSHMRDCQSQGGSIDIKINVTKEISFGEINVNTNIVKKID